MAPMYPFEVGVQSCNELGPVPSDPKGRKILENILETNAFTIDLTDRSLLFEVLPYQPFQV